MITRQNFNGAMASVYYGQYGEGDGAIKKGDVVWGMGNDRGSIVVSGEYRKEDGVGATDRWFTQDPRGPLHPTDNWTTVGAYGGFVTTASTPIPGIPAGTRVILKAGGDPRNPADYIRQNVATGTCAGATTSTGCTPGSIADKTNTLEQTDLRTPLESKSLNIDGNL